MGWQCIITPAAGFDLVATYENRFMRVQVKSTLKPERIGKYRFCFSKGSNRSGPYTVADADIFALVAIDIRRVYFVPVKYQTTQSLRLLVSEYTPFVEAETWHHSINNVIGSQWSD